MTLKNVKLIYFDTRGRAEPIRLILTLAGVKFEDVRLTPEAWAAEKPNAPFGQLPILEVDGNKYTQTVAIVNYLARETGLYGKTNLDSLKIDQIIQLTVDFINIGGKALFEKDEAKKAELFKNFKEVEAPKFLGFFEKLLKESGTGYFVGNSLTAADILVYEYISNFIQRKALSTEGYPLLQALFKKVESNEKIKAYLSTRKET